MKSTFCIILLIIYSCNLFAQNVKKDTISYKQNKLDEVVVSATKSSQKIKTSPVSVEKITHGDIKSFSSFTYYDELENIKGVDVNTGSLTFKSVNARGFATFANERFVQLIDGIDNSSPALNFVIGDFLALDELDVHSIEILPGASSALYGANAYNGLLNMQSKNPFNYRGISMYVKSGITSSSNLGDNGYTSFGIRAAHAFSKKLAGKVSFSFLEGTDWKATNYNDNVNSSFTRDNPNFNGLNIYGDEVSTILNFDNIAGVPTGTFGSSEVSRTGYEEEFLLTNDKAQNVKLNFALHYRPFEDDFEIILNSKVGRGNTIYHSSNRFAIRDFVLQHHKIELKNNNFFLRGYLTQETAGNSYDTRFAAINVNRLWKSDTDWFTDYATGFLGAITGQIPGVQAGDQNIAHGSARSLADQGRLTPNSLEFQNALNTVISDADLLTGAKLVDESKVYHADGNYNFAHLLKEFEFQVGGSIRAYSLDSKGTIFTDRGSPIRYNEYGAYLQAKKNILNDKIELTGSIRYDKSQNFDTNLSPRLSAVYNVDENKKHYLRGSFQQAFRNPTTQDQYIGLDIGNIILVGSAPDNLDRYETNPIALSTTAQNLGFGTTVTLTGRNAYENAFTLSSVEAFTSSVAEGVPNISLLEVSNVNFVQPEQITAFELGYRGSFNLFDIDIYGYYNSHKDFIRQNVVIAPNYGNVDLSDVHPTLATPNALIALSNGDITAFQAYTNALTDVNSYGGSVGIESRAIKPLDISLNYTFADLDYSPKEPNFQPRFNTPKHRVKASILANDIFDRFGFKINWRWGDSYLWQSDFATRTVSARSLVDAQINVSIPKWKSFVKLGAVNLLNNEYVVAPGASLIGSQYFISWTINN